MFSIVATAEQVQGETSWEELCEGENRQKEQWDFGGASRVAVGDEVLEKDNDLRSLPVSVDFLACCPEVLAIPLSL